VPKKTVVISNKISSTSSNISKESSLVNINNASSSELETLNGIGEATANKIIEYRDKNGGFKSVEELKNVSGIGEAKYKKIAENVTI
jgi:competence protein ComEA